MAPRFAVFVQGDAPVTAAFHVGRHDARELRRHRHLALPGFRRMRFAVRPTLANGDETPDGFAILESKLHVPPAECTDFIGTKASVRDEHEAASMRRARMSQQNANLLVGWYFEHALPRLLERRHVRRHHREVLPFRRKTRNGGQNDLHMVARARASSTIRRIVEMLSAS